MIRLDKFLADIGIGTRSEVKKLLKTGKIKVNNAIVKDSSTKIDIESDQVYYCENLLKYQKYFYYILNKPAGCISATKDGLSSTVLEFLKDEPTRDLFPVGRLDKDTEGLLLITNDGMLAHNLLSPKKHVNKNYIAYVSKSLSDTEIAEFESGVDIGDETLTLPSKIRNASADESSFNLKEATLEDKDNFVYESSYIVTLKEGRFHQIKRMFEHFSSKVLYLKRLSMGTLILDENLKPGEYRSLSEDEIESLKSLS